MEANWEEGNAFLRTQPFRWYSDEGILYVEHTPGREPEYSLKYIEDRFDPDTLAEGQEEVARTVDRLLD